MRKMKDSGIEWVGQIPEDWELTTYRRVFNRRKEYDDNDKQVLSLTIQGVKEKNESYGKMAEDFTGHQIVKKDDLVFTPRDFDATPILSGVAPCDGCISNLYFVLFPHDTTKTYVPYFNYFMWGVKWGGDIWRKLSYGMRFSYNFQQFGALPTVMPPIETQKHIADFLDEKCGKIDRYIAKQQQVIEKLKTYKQSVITEAVAYRNGWTSCHLGYLAQFKNGLNYSGLSTDVEIKFLGVGDFQAHFILDSKEMFSTLKFDGNMPEDLLLKSGDIVFVRSNGSKELVGRSVLIENIDYPLTYSGFCIRMRNYRQDAVLSKFLLYRFWSNEFRQSLNRDSRGSNINNLNQELLSKLTVSFPNIKEQRDIIDFLDKKCAEIDRTIDKKQLLIDKLTEYKKSLIYEAVTGKLEV